MANIEAIKKLIFLIFNTKKIFNYLWLAFIKALIHQYFDLKNHIQIKTNILGYAISGELGQLNLNIDVQPNDLKKSDFS